ncbi:hypothetical protein HBI20_104000 [Parastagonospora nodorum]|nr:hypothetical protein HBI20_104000 [Parastagonospora nodorum]
MFNPATSQDLHLVTCIFAIRKVVLELCRPERECLKGSQRFSTHPKSSLEFHHADLSSKPICASSLLSSRCLQ